MKTIDSGSLSFALLSTLAAMLSGCGDDETTPAAPIDIGLLASISGDLAGLGREHTDSTKLAFAEINAQGGVLGRQVRIALEDDGTSEASSQVGYAALLDVGAPVILGPTFSAGALAVSDLIKSGRTLTIGQTTTSPLLTTFDDGGYFYRVAASDVIQASVLAEVIADTDSIVHPGFKVEQLCVVYRDDGYGAALADTALKNLGTIDPTIFTTKAAYDPLQSDLSTVLDPCGDPVTAKGKGAILFVTFVADGAELVNNAVDRGWNLGDHRFFFTDGAHDKLLFTLLDDPSSLDGSFGTGPSGPDPSTQDGQRLRDFHTRYTKKYGREANFYAENAYDAAYMAAMAVEIAGSTEDHAGIVAALAKTEKGSPGLAGDWASIKSLIASNGTLDYKGASGEVDFDLKTGDLLPPYYVAVWSIVDSAIEIDSVHKIDQLP